MTGIPKARYYVVLFVLLVAGVASLGAVLVYARESDQALLERQFRETQRLSTRFDYRQCRDINQLKSVMYTIIEAALALPLSDNPSEEELAYKALLRSYLNGNELAARNCLAIIEQEMP